MAADGYIKQAGAIPIKNGRLCLISSRSGKRWVIPKGLIDPGQTAAETALQEAWEEAGLVGVLDPEPVGTYLYEKYGGTCHVTVFVLRVSHVAQDWPEREFRRRLWLSPAGAARRLDDPGLVELLRRALTTESTLPI